MTAPRVRVLDLAAKIPRPAEGVRIAAIDIGSNSIRQIVADVSAAGSIRIIDEMKAAPRLGAGLSRTGRLSAGSMRHALEAVQRMTTLARQLGAVRIHVVATSAVREAENRRDFLDLVREETGLEGAMALAKQYAAKVKRVYSIDTFVSSDSPAETTRFAHAPLGNGAVIRGLDNSAVAPPAEMDRIRDIARLQGIPLQVGATNGGTDGSDFVRYGVLHVSLSWPGRYSHSPVEVLDLRDLQALERLIYAIAVSQN